MKLTKKIIEALEAFTSLAKVYERWLKRSIEVMDAHDQRERDAHRLYTLRTEAELEQLERNDFQFNVWRQDQILEQVAGFRFRIADDDGEVFRNAFNARAMLLGAPALVKPEPEPTMENVAVTDDFREWFPAWLKRFKRKNMLTHRQIGGVLASKKLVVVRGKSRKSAHPGKSASEGMCKGVFPQAFTNADARQIKAVLEEAFDAKPSRLGGGN